MEKIVKKILWCSLLTLLVVVITGISLFIKSPVKLPIGSVSQNNQYEFSQLTGAIATTSVINAGITTLGSVIITEDQAGTMILYDATSTAAVGNGLTKTIAKFQAAETEGVYTFDTGLTYGLVYASADGFSFAGDWTITYRKGW
jgi:hypothetical protein